MIFSLTQIFSIGIGYLSFFFLVAYLTEKGVIPARLVRHPVAYTLSLGVFASVWAVYGSVGFAHTNGFNFIGYYLGVSATFMLTPILLIPLMRLIKNHQLGSLADLLAFRYRSPWVGAAVTGFMLLATIPLIALQIRAVTDSLRILNQETSPHVMAFMFCSLVIWFAILFGARHITTREKHEGLVMAIAFESLIKLITMISIALYVLFNVFDGPLGLNQWLIEHPDIAQNLYTPLKDGPWRSIIAAFCVAAVATPHMFHMVFTENLSPRALLTASWGLPIYLFIMALTVPVILWGALETQVTTSPEYFTLGLPIKLNNPVLAIIAFIAGLSAACGVMIVSTLALSAMCLNHLILPLSVVNKQTNLYGWLLWMRRALIATIIFASFGVYQLLAGRHSLSELGFLTFFAIMQFAPGLVGVLFWARANRIGLIAGLTVGIALWIYLLMLPVIFGYQVTIDIPLIITDTFPSSENTYIAAIATLFINALIFTAVSLLTQPLAAEKRAAETCNVDNLKRSFRWELSVNSARDFIDQLSTPLGNSTAKREVELALYDLGINIDETRPYSLRRLRDQLEQNLSGLLGPSVASEMIDDSLPYFMPSEQPDIQDIHHTENRLETYHHKLTGLAAELDNLRRFHRQTLQDLPISVCSLGGDGEVFGWNNAIAKLTNIKPDGIVGSSINHLPEPWRSLLVNFTNEHNTRLDQKEIEHKGTPMWLNLHKAAIKSEENQQAHQGLVIVIEDLTETHQLEQKLTHNERLASVGRLAAGVAHEIGNPITGIACLAQNLLHEFKNENSHENHQDITEMSEQILEQTKRVTRIVQSLVNFSHRGNAKLTQAPVPIYECAQEAIHLLSLSKEGKDAVFQNNITRTEVISGDRQRMTQVFINLLSNALDASPPFSPITINSKRRINTVTITIEDNGPGIPDEIKDQIFEPFTTTKDPGEGTGLGMAVVYTIIEEHLGHITVNSPINSESSGTRVTMTLPRLAEPEPEALPTSL